MTRLNKIETEIKSKIAVGNKCYYALGPIIKRRSISQSINHLTPNDHYSGRTAPLTSKRCILYIYSTNIGTEYF